MYLSCAALACRPESRPVWLSRRGEQLRLGSPRPCTPRVSRPSRAAPSARRRWLPADEDVGVPTRPMTSRPRGSSTGPPYALRDCGRDPHIRDRPDDGNEHRADREDLRAPSARRARPRASGVGGVRQERRRAKGRTAQLRTPLVVLVVLTAGQSAMSYAPTNAPLSTSSK